MFTRHLSPGSSSWGPGRPRPAGTPPAARPPPRSSYALGAPRWATVARPASWGHDAAAAVAPWGPGGSPGGRGRSLWAEAWSGWGSRTDPSWKR